MFSFKQSKKCLYLPVILFVGFLSFQNSAYGAYDANIVSTLRKSTLNIGQLSINNNYAGSVTISLYHSDAPTYSFGEWLLPSASVTTLKNYRDNNAPIYFGEDWGIQIIFGNGVKSDVYPISNFSTFKDGIISIDATKITLGTSASVFDVTENTKIKDIKNELGSPVRSLISEKKSTDFFDSSKYTFLDAYNQTFGVVILGIHPVSYRLSKTLDKKNTNLIKIQESNQEKSPEVSIFGVKLGMNFNDAEQLIYKLATFDKAMTAKNGGVEYKLTNGSRIVVNSDKNKVVTGVELFLN
jgi:hypothetical protein